MNGFVDEARITVASGHGGRGAVSFQRTKLKPRGRPDGGNGGRGGSVVFVSDPEVGSLVSLVRDRHHRAHSGAAGGPNNRTGADAPDLILRVAVGTVVADADTGEVLADLATAGVRYVAAPGGRGGRGNASLRSSVDRVPNFAESGEPGREMSLALELRLVADVGLLGPPNAGKSTLLGAISRADPKIADYPFTTLEPGLGVVEAGEERFVVADLPGLVEGASEGKGLGLRFLRHATRCRVLAAVVDLTTDAAGDLSTIAAEVETYDPELSGRLSVVVGNKIDLTEADPAPASVWAAQRGAGFVEVSAKLGTNLDELVAMLARFVFSARATEPERGSFAVLRPVGADPVLVQREGSGWRVHSERAERLVEQTPLESAGAVRRLQRRLRTLGVERALAREGARDGDDVFIGSATFEFRPEDDGRA